MVAKSSAELPDAAAPRAVAFDGGTKYMDGRAVFGSSKTIRGVLVSILVTTAGSQLLGLELKVGFLAGITVVLVNPQAVGQQASIRFQNRYCRCFLAVGHFR
jgi:hypothetical protein